MGNWCTAMPASPTGKRPMPMPMTSSWLSLASPAVEARHGQRQGPSLAAAVAAIVSVAAQRARSNGTLDALRDAVEAALDGATPGQSDPREGETSDLPRIADADPLQEERQLRALLSRMRTG
jgi:hypothetical protein